MITFIYGTTAELIKIAPIHHKLSNRGISTQLWSTGQQIAELPRVTEVLGLPEPNFQLAHGHNGHSLTRVTDIPRWLADVTRFVRRNRTALESALWSDHHPPIVLVHGDTLTTVVGAMLGRWLGATVGHIEAGLRTNKLLDPFPEELDRRVAAQLAHVHFAPGIDKFSNIWSTRGVKVDTLANTVMDSLKLVPDVDLPRVDDLPERFGIVSLHRFELLRNPARLEAILRLLHRWGEKTPMLLVADAQASEQLRALGLSSLIDGRRLIGVGKLPYVEFIPLLRRSEFVITDSGGLQEECAYLNKPCLVHRTTTERTEGIGTNVLLSLYDLDVVEHFLSDPGRYHDDSQLEPISPSEIIVDHLVRAGHATDETANRPDALPADVAVIVPAFNEPDLIKSAIDNLVRELSEETIRYEILVVAGDRHGNSTAFEAERVESPLVRVLRYAENAGRSFAFKYGVGQSSAPVIVHAELAMLVAPDNITRAVSLLQESGADVIAGSKVHAASAVPMTKGRDLQTGIFSSIVARLFDMDVSDAQLGLKVFRRPVLERVLPYMRSTGFAFEIELLSTANDLGYTIAESPVHLPGRMPTIRNPLWIARSGLGVLRLAVLRLQLVADRRRRPN